MKNNPAKWLITLSLAFGILGGTSAFAQQQDQPPPPSTGGWRKFGDPDPNRGYSTNRNPDYSAPANGPTNGPVNGPANGPADANEQPPLPPPSTLTIPAGTWISVRVNQPLSSDHNQPGDSFSASLIQPLVADGRVVARRGQTIQGRVAEAVKAGRASGTSRLGIELTELALVDGQQVPVKTQLIERHGDTSVGHDVGTVGVTAGAGAAIGAAAAGGFGAGVGALAGAGAATIGVLVTRGRSTVVYPETQLTFRLEQSVSVSTERSQQAFEPVGRDDYERQPMLRQGPQGAPGRPAPGYYPPPAYYGQSYYGPAPYYGGVYPYWGPSFYFYSGPRFYYGRGFRRW